MKPDEFWPLVRHQVLEIKQAGVGVRLGERKAKHLVGLGAAERSHFYLHEVPEFVFAWQRPVLYFSEHLWRQIRLLPVQTDEGLLQFGYQCNLDHKFVSDGGIEVAGSEKEPILRVVRICVELRKKGVDRGVRQLRRVQECVLQVSRFEFAFESQDLGLAFLFLVL